MARMRISLEPNQLDEESSYSSVLIWSVDAVEGFKEFGSNLSDIGSVLSKLFIFGFCSMASRLSAVNCCPRALVSRTLF